MTTSINHNDNKLTSVNDRIENCEAKGRQYFYKAAKNIFSDLESVSFTGTTDRHDCNVETKTKSFVVEIKVRTPAHDKYSTVIIKRAKYDYLMSGITDGFIPLYVNFYSDNTAVIWNLAKVRVVGKSMKYVRVTEMNSNSAMEWQEFYELHIDDAVTLKYTK